MSEYTFETAALKAVTIDAVKYNEEGLRNSIAPETIQAVAPLKWNNERVVFGEGAISEGRDVSLGKDTIAYEVLVWRRALKPPHTTKVSA